MHTTALRLRVWRRMRPVILQNFGLFLCFSHIHLLSKDSVTVFFYLHKTPFERQLIQQAPQKYLLFHTKRHLEERQELNVKPFFLMTTANKFQCQLPVIIEQIDDRLWTQIQLLVLTENHQKTFGFFCWQLFSSKTHLVFFEDGAFGLCQDLTLVKSEQNSTWQRFPS